MMTFGEAISSAFSKYATFSGRAPRSEYWWFVLFAMLLGFVAEIIDLAVNSGVIGTLVSLGLFLPGIAVSVRRMHDIERSGWWILLPLGAGAPFFVLAILFGGSSALIALGGIAALIGIVILFVFTVTPGTKGGNRYGADLLPGRIAL